MVYYEQGAKIECQHSEIIAKKITPSVPQKHPKIGLSIKYKCKRDGSALITKELDPKASIVNKESNLNLDDKLEANELYFIVGSIKRLTPNKIGGHSGRHSSQIINTNHFTFAEISKPFTHILNAIANRTMIE